MSESPESLADINTRIRDLEEKDKIMKDRVLLVGQTLIDERSKTFKEIQELKKTIITVREEQKRIKDLLERIVEQINNTARKEEVLILERQFNLLRDGKEWH